jgi:hypothetical protein
VRPDRSATRWLGRCHRPTTRSLHWSEAHLPRNFRVIEQSEFTLDSFNSALRNVDHVIYGIGLPEQFLFDNSVFEKVNCNILTIFLSAL